MTEYIVDTGPVVALLNRRDEYHAWAKDLFSQIEPPLYTCEAVLSEVCYLLQSTSGGTDAALTLVSQKIIVPDFVLADEIGAVRKLMAKYANVPMSLADACLVRMSEIVPKRTIVTLDSDFSVYRRLGKHTIDLLTP